VRRQFASNVLRLSGSGEINPRPGVTHIERRTPTEWQLTLAAEANPQTVLHTLTANGHFTVDRFEVGLPTLDEIFLQVVRNPATQP
jgi:ABC-2 type transport system ATP-binding protein